MTWTKQPFGTMPDGTFVEQITLQDGALSCRVLTYGATLQSLLVPDSCGNPTDVVLGYSDLDSYRAMPGFLGAVVGRYANRIAGGRFTLNGKAYILPINNNGNHLHGGWEGFDKKVWTVEQLSDKEVTLSLFSPDGDCGYPGNLTVQVTYRLENNALSIEYDAVSDADTICNLTNHAFFNLAGHNSGLVYEQEMQLFAGSYTETNEHSVPTGKILDVTGTPLDFRKPRQIGLDIDCDFPQIKIGRGFDLNWIIDNYDGNLRPAAKVYAPKTGIHMEVNTTMPGVQFYSGNYMDEITAKGKDGASYARHYGFCLETQFFPDSPNHPNFPSVVLKAGDHFTGKTVYRFDLQTNGLKKTLAETNLGDSIIPLWTM